MRLSPVPSPLLPSLPRLSCIIFDFPRALRKLSRDSSNILLSGCRASACAPELLKRLQVSCDSNAEQSARHSRGVERSAALDGALVRCWQRRRGRWLDGTGSRRLAGRRADVPCSGPACGPRQQLPRSAISCGSESRALTLCPAAQHGDAICSVPWQEEDRDVRRRSRRWSLTLAGRSPSASPDAA